MFWNGQLAVAGGNGSNTIATSTDGIQWTGKGTDVFANTCYEITWNTKRWVAVGKGGNTVAYSYDGNTWYSALIGNILSSGLSVGTNSKIGVTLVNSGLYLNTNDRLVINTPQCYDDSLMRDTSISIQMHLPES